MKLKNKRPMKLFLKTKIKVPENNNAKSVAELSLERLRKRRQQQ